MSSLSVRALGPMSSGRIIIPIALSLLLNPTQISDKQISAYIPNNTVKERYELYNIDHVR